MQPKGSLVVDELIVPISDVYLADGGIRFTAEIAGPCRAVDCDDYVVCDRDGRVVYRSTGVNRLRWRRVSVGTSLEISVLLDLIGKRSVRT